MKKIIVFIIAINSIHAEYKINLPKEAKIKKVDFGKTFEKGLRKGLYSITHVDAVLKKGEKEEIKCNKKYWKYYHESSNLYWSIRRYNDKFKKEIQKYGFKFYEMKRAIGKQVTIDEQAIEKESCSPALAKIKKTNEKNIATELEANRILYITITSNHLKLKDKIRLLIKE